MSKNVLTLKKDRLFFHDIVNHTHGILLYLSSRDNLSQSEIAELKQEVKALQGLIKDHYKFEHKNLKDVDDWVPLKVAFKSVESMCEVYLTNQTIQYEIENCADQEVYFPSFIRVMNNLVKNMAEAKATNVSIKFSSQNTNLLVETKNTFLVVDKNDQRDRLGLESIKEHVESFNHKVTNNVWVNKLTFVTKGPQKLREAA